MTREEEITHRYRWRMRAHRLGWLNSCAWNDRVSPEFKEPLSDWAAQLFGRALAQLAMMNAKAV